MSIVRIGVIGCGEAAQVMHLPTLALLGDRFTVTALADVSPTVAENVGERFAVPVRSNDWRELLVREDVDAVLVAAPNAYHGEVTVAALEAGKHVLVEKPLCLTRREAERVIAEQARSGLVLQVGYMRRYAQAFAAARERVGSMTSIRFARVRNVLGRNELIADQANATVRAHDVSPAVVERAAADQDALLAEQLGDGATPEERHTYMFLLSLCSHDTSAMRDLLGPPRSVLYARRRNGPPDVGPMITAAFDYGTFVCHLEAGFDRLPRVEQDVTVYGTDEVVQVAHDTGFVRGLPARATVTEAVGGTGTATMQLVPAWEDAFVAEWRAFHASVVDGTPVRASAADAAIDLEICLEMAAAIATSSGSPVYA